MHSIFAFCIDGQTKARRKTAAGDMKSHDNREQVKKACKTHVPYLASVALPQWLISANPGCCLATLLFPTWENQGCVCVVGRVPKSGVRGWLSVSSLSVSLSLSPRKYVSSFFCALGRAPLLCCIAKFPTDAPPDCPYKPRTVSSSPDGTQNQADDGALKS